MGKLFTGKKFRFVQRDEIGIAVREWVRPAIDQKAKVVCENCNGGWMSNLESYHAKPAMADLIVGNHRVPFKHSRTTAIARFAFKTAVVLDHMGSDEPFFDRKIRHHFAKSLKVPRDVQMWFAGFLPMASGRVSTGYRKAPFNSERRSLQLYACTYGVGHFVFQVVSVKHKAIPSFSCKPGFEDLSVPLWPGYPSGFVWPPESILKTWTDFYAYADRWSAIQFAP